MLENDKIIINDNDIAEEFVINIVDKLKIGGFPTKDFDYSFEIDHIGNIIAKFKEHPSMLKIKDKPNLEKPFFFPFLLKRILQQTSRRLMLRNLHSKIFLVGFLPEIVILFLHILRESIATKSNCIFPNTLKFAEITPGHKKDDYTKTLPRRIIIDQLACFHPFRRYSEEVFLTKFLCLSPFYMALEKDTVHNTGLLSYWNEGKKYWIKVK